MSETGHAPGTAARLRAPVSDPRGFVDLCRRESEPDPQMPLDLGWLRGPRLRAGERVIVTAYVPLRCRGLVRGRVAFHQPGSEPDELPFPGSLPSGPLVGTYRARIPGRP